MLINSEEKRNTFFSNSNRNSNGISMDTTDCCFHDLTKAKLKHEDTRRGEGLYRKVEGWQGSPYALTKSQYRSARSRKPKDPKSASQMQQQWLVFGPQSRGHIASSLVMAETPCFWAHGEPPILTSTHAQTGNCGVK